MKLPHIKGKLKTKIFLMMVVVSVVPIVLAGALTIWNIYTSHDIDIANLEDALLRQKSNEVQNFVSKILGELELQVTYDQTSEINLPGQNYLLGLIFKDDTTAEEVSFLNLKGAETYRVTRASPDGVSPESLRDESNLPKFKEVIATGKDYVGPVYYTLKGPMITLSAPVRNKNGIIVAVLTGEFSLSSLKDIIRKAHLGDTGYLYLVDQNGFLIAGGFGEEPLTSLKAIPVVSRILQKQDSLGSDGQMRYDGPRGDAVVAAGTYLPLTGWGLAAEWPTQEADAILKSLLYKNLLMTLIVFVATLLLSILLATFIVSPIKELETGTQRIAQGKFDEPVQIKTGDEIEDLGVAFNKMMVGLKELQQLKDEFVFIAAHELRTPVAAMKGYLSLILDGITGPITGQTKDFIEKVIASNQRLIQLVNDLLEVARSEAGRLTIKVSPLDITEPVKSVISELTPLADEHAVKISYVIPQNLPKVSGDSDRLKEVLVNLMGNSIKYMGGAGQITIAHDVKNGELVTSIKDTGLGMSKEAQAKLFEKFYRVQTDKTKDITGTGLGLFIVKQIIEKMNGRIWVESEEGKGSTFSFALPIAS